MFARYETMNGICMEVTPSSSIAIYSIHSFIYYYSEATYVDELDEVLTSQTDLRLVDSVDGHRHAFVRGQRAIVHVRLHWNRVFHRQRREVLRALSDLRVWPIATAVLQLIW